MKTTINWIPVSERTPNHENPLLLSCCEESENGCATMSWVEIGNYAPSLNSFWRSWQDVMNPVVLLNVTHWAEIMNKMPY